MIWCLTGSNLIVLKICEALNQTGANSGTSFLLWSDKTISLAANPGVWTWMLTHEPLASHPWLSLCFFFFFRIFGPVGAGVYQCLLWAAMPITELCTRGWGIEIQWPSARMGVFLDVLQVNEGERSVVSMRDIGRAARVFKWLLDWCKQVSLLGQILYCEILFLFAMMLWKNFLRGKNHALE